MRTKIYRRSLIQKLGVGTDPGNLLFNDFYNIPDKFRDRLSDMISKGALSPGHKGKLKINLKAHTLTPWWTPMVESNRDCTKLHEVFFEFFSIIPRKCRECWKTVVLTDKDPERQYVSDLFKLRDILRSTGFPCKCGVDIRQTTPNRYSGFVYGDSLAQARVYHSTLTELVKGKFKNPKLIVKRGCTEFEEVFRDSSKWDEHTDEFNAIEDYLDYIIETHDVPAMLGYLMANQAETFKFWIDYAHGIGDSTWKEALKSQGYEPPEVLFFKPKTYHEEQE
jgi:hypothetical protein